MDFSPAQNLVVNSYLKGTKIQKETYKFTAFFGESSFRDMNLVKKLATGTGDGEKSQCVWEPQRKLWGTRSLRCLGALINSGLWRPEGVFDSKLIDEIGRRALAKATELDAKQAAAEAEAAEKVEREEREAEAARQAEVERRAEMVRTATEKARIRSTPVEIAEAVALGLSEEDLEKTVGLAALGPSAGLPPIIRIRRWLYHHRHLHASDVVADLRKMLEAKAQPETNNAKRPVAAKRPRTATAGPAVAATAAAAPSRDDPNAAALRVVLENAARAPAIRVPLLLTCSRCKTKPVEQFMGCECSSEWRRCYTCNFVFNATTAPCCCCV